MSSLPGNINLAYLQRSREVTPNVTAGVVTPPGGSAPVSSKAQSNSLGVKKVPRRIDLDLSVARTGGELSSLIQAIGNVIAVMKSTYPTDEIEIKVDDDGDWVPLGPGSGLEGYPFERLRVRNVAQVGSSMVIIYTSDVPGDRVSNRYR